MPILINDNTARVQYTATSGQTTFAVPFEFFENGDLKVYRNSTLQTITTHYTLTGAGVTGGGNLTFVSGVTLNDIITIVRDIPIKRVTDFPLSGPFNIAALNLQLDQLTAMVQEVNTLVTTRVPLLAEFDQPSALSALPTRANRANNYFVFDANGNPAVASSALAVTDFIAAGTGAVLRSVQDKMRDIVSVKDFGAVADGVTDDGPAFTLALAAASTVTVPAGVYLVNTTVTVPAGKTLFGAGRNSVTINTATNVTVLNVTGNGVAIEGITFDNAGTGRIVSAPQRESLVIKRCAFQSAAAASTNALIYTSGSFATIRDNVITTFRTNAAAYALVIDRTLGVINIESSVHENRFGGTGRAMLVYSSDTSPRPEGVLITDNTFIGTAENLVIETVLQATVANNVFDQGNTGQVVLKPVNTGIENVQFTGNYFSTPNQTTNGVGVNHDNTNPAVPLRHISFTGNTFAFCGFGLALKSGASRATVTGNTFAAIGSGAISMDQAATCVVTSNTFGSISGANLILTDGASGGPFIVDANQFDSAIGHVITRTSNNKFIFGGTNQGKPLAGWCSVATDTTAKPTGSFLAIPHGLAGTPRKDRIIVTVSDNVAQFLPTPTAKVSAVDATNITVELSFTAAVPGAYTVSAWVST